MIYIDTSCLVKAVRIETDSEGVGECLEQETEVIVSTLAELEAVIELKAGYMGGAYSSSQWRKLEAQLFALRNNAPFIFKAVPFRIWDTAFRQHRNSENIYCRTLDRLHLAIMEEFGLRRLMTHDAAQTKAAQALGFEVISPGR